ncbi:MAG: HAD-IB family phosphatase [Candidatus Jordarchaeales archaeon]
MRREPPEKVEVKVVVFDFDGVLYEGDHSVRFADELGFGDAARKLYSAMVRGEISFEEGLRRGAELWRGVSVEAVKKAMGRLELRAGVEETFITLRSLGYRTALVSCGGSNIGFLPVKKRLGINYVYSNPMESRKGVLTGRIAGSPMTPKRKAEVLAMIAEREGVTLAECAAVGNDALDIPMFKLAGLTIGVNPSPEAQKHVMFSINLSNMKDILKYLT